MLWAALFAIKKAILCILGFSSAFHVLLHSHIFLCMYEVLLSEEPLPLKCLISSLYVSDSVTLLCHTLHNACLTAGWWYLHFEETLCF